MPEMDSIAKALAEHCFDDMSYLHSLLNTGALPEGWADRYLELLAVAKTEYAGKAMWPRELAAAAYTVSVYCPKRYRDWQSFNGGGANLETERVMEEIRWAADEFLVSPFLPDHSRRDELTSGCTQPPDGAGDP